VQFDWRRTGKDNWCLRVPGYYYIANKAIYYIDMLRTFQFVRDHRVRKKEEIRNACRERSFLLKKNYIKIKKRCFSS
jgi:hypothetical protein